MTETAAVSAGLATTTGTTGVAQAQQSLGKDDFLRLLVAQLNNQDPLQPMDNTEFVAQLAQFSSLEQLVNVSDGLAMVQLAELSSGNVQAASLVGKEITAAGNGFTYSGTGEQDLSFDLAGLAETVTVRIVDEGGATVRTMELGRQDSGTVSFSWDGRTDAGVAAGPGQYSLEIEAHDSDGGSVEATTTLRGIATGIFFDQGYAELEVGGTRVRLGDVIAITEPGGTSDGTGDEGR